VLHYWPFGASWCRIWLAVDVWMCTASIYNLVAISIDRYVAVSRPIRYASLMSPARAKLLIVVVWILSFVICFPPLIGWNGPADRLERPPPRRRREIQPYGTCRPVLFVQSHDWFVKVLLCPRRSGALSDTAIRPSVCPILGSKAA